MKLLGIPSGTRKETSNGNVLLDLRGQRFENKLDGRFAQSKCLSRMLDSINFSSGMDWVVTTNA